MNESRIDRILRTLLRAGKAKPDVDAAKAELGFETRLMATIRERKAAAESPWLVWHRVVWRLAPAMAAVVLVLGGLSFLGTNGNSSSLSLVTDPLGFELVLADHLLGGGL